MAQTHYRYHRSAIGSGAFPRRGGKGEESTPKRRGSAKIGTTTKQISKKRRVKTVAISSSPPKPKEEEYDSGDRIVGHTATGNGHSVSLITERAADQSRRTVPEIIVQQATPSKVYAYWGAFGKSREETIGTDHFNVKETVLAHPGDVPATKPPNRSPVHITASNDRTPTMTACWELSTVVIKGPPRDPRLRQKKLSAFGRNDYWYVRTLVKALESRREKGLAFEEDDLRFLREVRFRIERDLKFEWMVRQTKREMRQSKRKARPKKDALAKTNSTGLT
ncbi:hypothetical protein CcaCcLH18_03412 [Colletotrichum camelliae]|nr:hypothetical protein CcaCcLH18_03412 [Colletotrichum camelliae]